METPRNTSYTECRSPVIESLWKKRLAKQLARRAVKSTCLSLLIIFIIYLDMNNSTLCMIIDFSHPVLWYLQLSVICLIIIRIVQNIFEIFQYALDTFFDKKIEISTTQRKLLGVGENEKGFYTTPPKPKPTPAVPSQQQIFKSVGSPTKHTPNFSKEGSPYSPMHFKGMSPGSFSQSFNSSMTAQSPYSSFGSTSRSLNNSYNQLNSSYRSRLGTPELSALRSRNSCPSSRNSPVSPYDRISTIHSLTSFLKEQEDEEYKMLQVSSENMSGINSSFWNFGSSPIDNVHLLTKYQYQVSTRSPQSPSAKHTLTDIASNSGVEEVWGQFGVTENDIYIWTENLRKWISLTIVSRLAREIKDINIALRRIGCEDTQIGEVGVSTLKQLALTKGNLIPGFNSVVPYLDFSSNQEYLTKRILDLGKDGCMSEFCWNSGGHYGKQWGEHLPTDSMIVMHLLCTYMDSRLPAQPRFPDGKTFTSQYFMKTPDKPNTSKKDNLLLYQSSINPPFYQVIFGENIFSLPKGRNNMFQALLLFLYHVKHKRNGMLGRINLGLSGINLLWIFDNQTSVSDHKKLYPQPQS